MAAATTVILYYVTVLGVLALPIRSVVAIDASAEIEYQLPKKTHISFYPQEIYGGSNPTTIKVVQGLNTTNFYNYGDIFVLQANLTENQNPNSKVVGRMQGSITVVSETQDLDKTVLQLSITLVFAKGIYNESTVVILGRASIGDKVREIPIVGGTGLFGRMARGYVLLSTVLFDTKSGYVTQEANACIFHY